MIRSLFGGKSLFLVALMGLAALVGGCSEPYLSGYNYVPQPAVVNVAKKGAQNEIPLTVLASIVGIRNADSQHHVPYAIEVQLQFENNGPVQVVFNPSSIEMVTGTLAPFPPPQVEPPGTMVLSPGDRRQISAIFPLGMNVNPDQMNLANLRLRWTVEVNGYRVDQTALFERTPAGYSANSSAPPAGAYTY